MDSQKKVDLVKSTCLHISIYISSNQSHKNTSSMSVKLRNLDPANSWLAYCICL